MDRQSEPVQSFDTQTIALIVKVKIQCTVRLIQSVLESNERSNGKFQIGRNELSQCIHKETQNKLGTCIFFFNFKPHFEFSFQNQLMYVFEKVQEDEISHI